MREELSFAISQPIEHPERFAAMGLSTATGVLLYGPPGVMNVSDRLRIGDVLLMARQVWLLCSDAGLCLLLGALSALWNYSMFAAGGTGSEGNACTTTCGSINALPLRRCNVAAGCGKTLLAKAVANESGANFISIKVRALPWRMPPRDCSRDSVCWQGHANQLPKVAEPQSHRKAAAHCSVRTTL